MRDFKKEIWYILTIIGTSCGVIGGWFGCATKGLETGDMFLFWSGTVTVVGMVISTIVWGVKFIIVVKKHLRMQKAMLSDIEIAYADDLEKSMKNKAKRKGGKNGEID